MSQFVQEKFDLEFKAEILRQQTEDNLRNNPAYKEFFSQFNQSSVESFIRGYARRKALYSLRGEEFMEQEEANHFRYKVIAEEGLWAIQQKKLFNLQCQWRAEQIQLRGIDHSTQFLMLSANIQHCQFLTPVNSSELELYMNYLCSDTARLNAHFDNWQDYEGFKAEYQSGNIPSIDDTVENQLPAWYQYYDEHMNTATLLDLPDIRGEKENRYRSISRQRQLEQMKQSSTQRIIDDRPFLSIYDSELVESFVRKFEDRQTLRYCKAIEGFQKKLDESLEVDAAIEILKNAGKKIRIQSTDDWKEGVVAAANRFELEQVATLMPMVFQEYMFRRENGINFPHSYLDRKREEYAVQLCDKAKHQIMEGRRILGEPENFRF